MIPTDSVSIILNLSSANLADKAVLTPKAITFFCKPLANDLTTGPCETPPPTQ